MRKDIFNKSRLSEALTFKWAYMPFVRTPWFYCMHNAGTKDNGVFVKGVKLYEDCYHSKASC